MVGGLFGFLYIMSNISNNNNDVDRWLSGNAESSSCEYDCMTMNNAASDVLSSGAAMRRVSLVGGHLSPRQSSYTRVHGEVSRAPLVFESVDLLIPILAPPTTSSQRNDSSSADYSRKNMNVKVNQHLCEVVYEKSEKQQLGGGRVARITINRPERRNAFTPRTVMEMARCFEDARDDSEVGVVVLTGRGTEAFCRYDENG